MTDTRQSLHIYTVGPQPATRYEVNLYDGTRPVVFTCAARQQIRCANCGRRRWASRLSVQVYYDVHRFACTDRAQCEHDKHRKHGRRGSCRGPKR